MIQQVFGVYDLKSCMYLQPFYSVHRTGDYKSKPLYERTGDYGEDEHK